MSQTHHSSNPTATIIILIIALIGVVALWKVFTKAGKPGWAAIVPFYNIYTMCKIAGRPGWWTILMIIPGVNLIFGIIIAVDIAKAFGKGGAFGFFLLWLLSVIGYLILGFGRADYHNPHPAS